jgi:signal transduction histidine kinase
MHLHGRITAAIRVLTGAVITAIAVSPARAQGGFALSLFNEDITPAQLVLMVAMLGAVSFALVSAIVLIRMRNRLEVDNRQLTLEVGALKALVERAEALVNEEDQRLVAWNAPDEEPLVAGALPAAAGTPADSRAFVTFADWVRPDSATRLEHAIHRLRTRGEPFNLTIASQAERMIEARGRTVGASAVVRFRDLSGDRLARARIEARHDRLAAEVATLRSLLAAVPMPMWLRDETGHLTWVNAAYATAVEAHDADDAIKRALELVDTAGRRALATAHADGAVATRRLPAIVAGSRRLFDVTDIAAEGGSAGIGVDVTEVEAASAALRREVDFNARTLDQLMTAVAIFGPDRRLKSYNAAYRGFFDLDAGFLDSAPDEAAVLDRLRAARKLPEQSDFRSWRNELLAAYRSLEAREFHWHLPDGQTLRVIANPHPQGGITWIYENVTERLDLESRYNALVSVQGETLDHLTEGVAVFGSDGRLRLHNPSFGEVWGIPAPVLDGRPHVSDIVAACRRPNDDATMWSRFTASVAGLDESRSSIAGRMERADGRTIDYATVPLPDGQTMVTFVDVTDSVKVERALVEKNEALVTADQIKNTFIHHVSYELRSPLTNIMGFAQLLGDHRVGPLTDKQREYVGYIMQSSGQLLAIVNDILDLSSIDAGMMELDLGEVDAAETVNSAVAALRDKFLQAHLALSLDVAPDAGRFIADARRIRQILINLLSNAIAFSEDRGRVQVSARRLEESVEFAVSDDGPGIPNDFLRSAFDRFASMPRGGGRGGVGLGLSIVKSFVALHGGTVEIQSEEGKGATVTVRLPIRPPAASAIAAE